MGKPVSDAAFWRERLATAKSRGVLHHSVYITRDEHWAQIEAVHRSILRRETDETMRVLDAGCGYGRMSDMWVKYTGVDISPDLLAEARERYPGKAFMEGDLKKLPFTDGEFDVAFCVSIRHMIVANLGGDEWEAIARELSRVAKKVLILEYGDPGEPSCESYEIL